MSWNPALDPSIPVGDAVDAIEAVIVPRARDLGGFEVRRALSSAKTQMVGPFIFFDQMGPAEFILGTGIDGYGHQQAGDAARSMAQRGQRDVPAWTVAQRVAPGGLDQQLDHAGFDQCAFSAKFLTKPLGVLFQNGGIGFALFGRLSPFLSQFFK
mgnify:CR=1 FL=1